MCRQDLFTSTEFRAKIETQLNILTTEHERNHNSSQGAMVLIWLWIMKAKGPKIQVDFLKVHVLYMVGMEWYIQKIN